MTNNPLSKHGSIRPLWAALDHACSGLTLNDVVKKMTYDHKAQPAIVDALKGMGISRLASLTNKSEQAMIALSFYAGDGIVAKVIPADFFDKSDPIYSMPPIEAKKVVTDDREYIVATYPWVSSGGVNQNEIEALKETLSNQGMKFSENDDSPKNVHRMPDENGTLVGIDSDMYQSTFNGKFPNPNKKQAWREYIEELYPIYKSGITPPQTDNTNFDFVSIHNQNPKFAGFNADYDDPIVKMPESKPANKSFWSFLSRNSNEAPPEPA